ncbi:hypothetical protein [Rhizobium johnstonii]
MYPWVIEGDIKGCFDNINHHHLLERMRKRIVIDEWCDWSDYSSRPVF